MADLNQLQLLLFVFFFSNRKEEKGKRKSFVLLKNTRRRFDRCFSTIDFDLSFGFLFFIFCCTESTLTFCKSVLSGLRKKNDRNDENKKKRFFSLLWRLNSRLMSLLQLTIEQLNPDERQSNRCSLKIERIYSIFVFFSSRRKNETKIYRKIVLCFHRLRKRKRHLVLKHRELERDELKKNEN